MAKRTVNPIEVKATISFCETDGGSYCIDDVSIHYGLRCDDGLEMRKGLALEKNQEILNIIKDFIEEGLQQVDTHEEIPEVVSMLDYNGAPDNLTTLEVDDGS